MDGAVMERRSGQYIFGRFCLDVDHRTLAKDGEPCSIQPKLIDLLTVLVENAGEVVDKETILKRVWQDTFVTDSSLTKTVCLLRKALDDEFIRTVPKRGYCFNVKLEKPENVDKLKETRRSWRLLWLIAASLTIMSAVFVRIGPGRTSMTEADRNYLVGQYMWNKIERADIEKAIERFRRATELNPKLAIAHAGLADAYTFRAILGMGDAHKNIATARTAAMRAMELDPKLARARVSLAFVKTLADFDPAAAERLYHEALKLEPGSAYVNYGYSCLLAHSGRLDEAWSYISKAREIDPVSPLVGIQAARIEYYRRNFSHAIELGAEVLDREPSFSLAHYYVALSLGFLGRPDDALIHLRKARLNPSMLETDEAWLRSIAGDRQAPSRLLTERRELVESRRARPVAILLPALDAQNKDLGLWALEQMAKTRELELLQIKVNPRFDPVRTEPRFIAVVRQIWPETERAPVGQPEPLQP